MSRYTRLSPLWNSFLMYFHPGKRPWLLVKQADIALPSATQNEVSEEEAKGLVAAGVRIVAEGSNMVRLRDRSMKQCMG